MPNLLSSSDPVRRYLWLFGASCALLAGAIAALNYVVDPYLIHQWDNARVQRLRPTREQLSVWGKTYAIARWRPDVLYLGNSRTELGLPATVPQFAGRRVFNAALAGSSIGDAIALAAFAARQQPLHTVVWGLDLPTFTTERHWPELDGELTAPGPFFFGRRVLLDVKRGLNFAFTRDSVAVLAGRFGAVCQSSLVFYGQRDPTCMAHRVAELGGSGAVMAARLRDFIRNGGPSPAAHRAFDASVGAMCRAGTRVRLYLNPSHALSLDGWYWAGKWTVLEQWESRLAADTARLRMAGCDIRLLDFSGYNSVTTESIPAVSGRSDMRNYWEASHYRDNVGRWILARLFDGAGAAPPDFGIVLTPAMLPDHLRTLRAARDRYHAEHAVETALVRAIAQE